MKVQDKQDAVTLSVLRSILEAFVMRNLMWLFLGIFSNGIARWYFVAFDTSALPSYLNLLSIDLILWAIILLCIVARGPLGPRGWRKRLHEGREACKRGEKYRESMSEHWRIGWKQENSRRRLK